MRCPTTGTALRFPPSPDQPFGVATFGVLEGGARRYPVIDDVPIFLPDRVDVLGHVSSDVEAPGPTIDGLLELLDSGESLATLVQLLTMRPRIVVRGHEVRGSRRVTGSGRLGAFARSRRSRLVARTWPTVTAAGRSSGGWT